MWSRRRDFPVPDNAPAHLYQPFSLEEWAASSFADAADVQRFRDLKYGMFIHFGLSTYKNAGLSWDVCHTRKAPDCGEGPYPDEEWQRWSDEFRFERFDAREWVTIAREAGFRYVVLIAKQHDAGTVIELIMEHSAAGLDPVATGEQTRNVKATQ